MRKIVTRKGRLERKIRIQLSTEKPDVGKILDAIDTFEKDNINTIEKLKKKKQLDAKRINGALKQTISAHGPITKLLLGSATKRVLGALMSAQEPEKNKMSIRGFLLGVLVGTIIYALLF